MTCIFDRSIANRFKSFTCDSFLLWVVIFNSCHKCSIGFRSGDSEGHSINLTIFFLNHLKVDFEICLDSLSKDKLPIDLYWINVSKRSFQRMEWYCSEFILSCKPDEFSGTRCVQAISWNPVHQNVSKEGFNFCYASCVFFLNVYFIFFPKIVFSVVSSWLQIWFQK